MRQKSNEECKCAGKCKCKAKKITKFMKDMKEQTQPLKSYECELDKVLLEQISLSLYAFFFLSCSGSCKTPKYFLLIKTKLIL